jgi:hypothetical protein
MISFRLKPVIRESTLDRWGGAELQLLGAGMTMAVSVRSFARWGYPDLMDSEISFTTPSF